MTSVNSLSSTWIRVPDNHRVVISITRLLRFLLPIHTLQNLYTTLPPHSMFSFHYLCICIHPAISTDIDWSKSMRNWIRASIYKLSPNFDDSALLQSRAGVYTPSIISISHVPKIPILFIYFFGMDGIIIDQWKIHALVTKFLLGCPGVAHSYWCSGWSPPFLIRIILNQTQQIRAKTAPPPTLLPPYTTTYIV